ncbi:MAG: hypothetical protein SFY80_02380 [Verrucomicrobiota bacterium]|nr:hypothetical protein [Verrucomicrobiota bacterium]
MNKKPASEPKPVSEPKKAKKTVDKSQDKPVKKVPEASKPVSKKETASTAKNAAKGAEATVKKTAIKEPEVDPKKLEAIKNLLHKPKHTPAVFKVTIKKQAPVVFTLEDVREVLKSRTDDQDKPIEAKIAQPLVAEVVPIIPVPPAPVVKIVHDLPPPRPRVVAAANLADILGFIPVTKKPTEGLVREVPRKWAHYHRLLMDLRNHLRERLNIHSEETLNRSTREDAGDHAGVSQHIADAGTDAFDRDFALGLVSNEKEALAEIEAAIERIYEGTYGVCEITQQSIAKERLEAVPFTRYSLDGQAEYEKTHRRVAHRAQFFADLTGDEAGAYGEETPDE